jgi:hypothetical protein
MDEEFYAVVKLVSGEELFSLVSPAEENGVDYLILYNPIKINKQDVNNDYSLYKVEPWLKLTTENIYILEKAKIITVVESTDEYNIKIYKKYVNKTKSVRGGYSLSRSEGYIANIKKARMLLEKIYRNTR